MFNTLLITFGLEVVLTYLAQLAFSADFRTINPLLCGQQHRSGANRAAVSSASGLRSRDCVDGRHVAVPFRTKARTRHSRHRAEPGRGSPLRRRASASLCGDVRYRIALAGAAGASTARYRRSIRISARRLTAKSFAISIIGGLDNPLGVMVGGLFWASWNR